MAIAFRRAVPIVGSALLTLILAAPSGAAEPWPALDWSRQPYLAAAHAAEKKVCSACHGEDRLPSDGLAEVDRRCADCHGSLADMGKETDGPINPHRSHLGTIGCTVCHRGHAPSRAYCLNCHQFAMDMPRSRPCPAPRQPFPPELLVRPAVTPQQADVVVIGAGGAGFTAAIAAREAGAKVVLLEKQRLTGGNTMLANGGMNAAGTRVQQARGIDDSPARMEADTLRGGHNVNDPRLVKILAGRSASSLEWLTQLGADLSDVGRLGGSSVDRTHRPRGGASVGAHLIGVLRRSAAAAQIDVRVNSPVSKILHDGAQGVGGVVVEGRYRGTYTIHARAVVLATGGFSANARRVARYRPEFAGLATTNQPGATGDGIDLGQGLDVAFCDLAEIQLHPTLAAGTRIIVSEAIRGNGAILVNRQGRRFVDEVGTRDRVSAAILAQPGRTAFLLFDGDLRRGLRQAEGYFHLGLAKQAATPADLAALSGLPADALQATLAAYGRACRAGSDPDFGRTSLARALGGPLCAIEVAPGIHYTMGGVKIDPRCQVLDTAGRPIAGLFAVGEATGGVHGANRLGGNSISEAITFGRIAGRGAARVALERAAPRAR